MNWTLLVDTTHGIGIELPIRPGVFFWGGQLIGIYGSPMGRVRVLVDLVLLNYDA